MFGRTHRPPIDDSGDGVNSNDLWEQRAISDLSMGWGRLAACRSRIKARLAAAFREDYTPREVAASFSVGTFITALPTLGTGVVVLVVIAYLFERASAIALFVAAVVLNPVAKWGVYAASFWLGSKLLGPVPIASWSDVSLSAGPDVVVRLLVGNFLLAVVFSFVGYVLALKFVHEYRRRDVDPVEISSEVLSE